MAKKFVRGITDVKTINNQDFDTNNVNDLLSDGQHNYIHRKKGNTEEYHNLTNNIKTIESSNTSLLSVTNYNNSTNSAKLTPKHDRRKEQVLESSDETIVINHGENGTEETTNVDVNPEIVLQHDNLISNSEYVTIEHVENTSVISTDELETELDELNSKIPSRIGTVNLFTGSKDFSGTWEHSDTAEYAEDYQGVKIFKKNTMWNGFSQFFDVKTGEEYVFSAYVKSSANTDSISFMLGAVSKNPKASALVTCGSATGEDTVGINITGEYQRITVKILITRDGWIMPRLERSNTDAYLFFGGYKFERSNIASDWSPAPEDFDSKIIEIEEKIPKTVSLLNLAQDTSLIWTPYVDITQNNNWDYTLCNLNYGNETGIYNNTKINLSVFISADDVELDSAYTPKIYLNSYDVKKDGTGNDWNAETDCFLGKFTKTLVAGKNYYVVKASMTTLPNAETLYSSIVPQIRIDGASSGKFHVRALMVTTGDIMPDYWLPSVNDNQVLTRQTYTHANATLKTHAKSLYQNYIISTIDEEFNFLAKMDKASSTATFTLNEHDTTAFENIINNYGENGTVNISGCAFSLSDSTLTFNCNSATDNPYVVSFSDIITQTE